MLVAAIADRLIAQCPRIRLVRVATQPMVVTAATPAVVVVPLAREPRGNTLVTGVSQLVRHTVGLLVTVRHAAEAATGAPALDLLEAVLDEIEMSLRGWAPGEEWSPLEQGPGAVEVAEPGHVTWRDTWITARLHRSVNLG